MTDQKISLTPEQMIALVGHGVTHDQLDATRRELSDQVASNRTGLSGQIEKLDGKVDRVDTRLSSQLEKLDEKIDRVDVKLSDQIEKLDEKIDRVDSRLSNQIEKLDEKVDRVDLKIDNLKSWMIGAMFTIILGGGSALWFIISKLSNLG
ncbi:hypothetical protein [Vibrio sp. ER1A]|uniref:hypothetical protein n=1 Tax=Vibrio sp. ER1A TaxID=1517681 RepID=UPI0004DD77E2|nr:hypothetical protein [Vibrio sp. ER1A]KFA99607.1 hypothetical protein HW45_02650 [Vibrio sp. ER1A]